MLDQLDLFPAPPPSSSPALPVDRPVTAAASGIPAFDWRTEPATRRCPMPLQRLAFAPVWRRRRPPPSPRIVPAPGDSAAWRCAYCGAGRDGTKGHTGVTMDGRKYLVCPGKTPARKRRVQP